MHRHAVGDHGVEQNFGLNILYISTILSELLQLLMLQLFIYPFGYAKIKSGEKIYIGTCSAN